MKGYKSIDKNTSFYKNENITNGQDIAKLDILFSSILSVS